MEFDKIRIENLEIYAYHGVFPDENEKGQKFFLNAILYTHTRKAGKSDDLTLSTNYGEVCEFMNTYVTGRVCKLLETVAEGLAEAVLLKFPHVAKLLLEIRKPDAPIAIPFESVSVQIERGWHTAYIAFGSNMGNRDKYIEEAIRKIKEHALCNATQVSSILRTEPYGGQAEGEFLNGVLEMKTLLPPEELLEVLNQIEAEAGRERTVHWGSRTLDLDILLYDEEVISTPKLTIPHIDMENRDFVLEPLCEIAPFIRHPITHKTIKQILDELKATQETYAIK
ncbi:MAG: 2-amino-4-hydroxy-6-hydroxymethyldihydropteridine diphosphokinase [Lachnospiraceae bacterium]|nr:2-amino-4-hydroxy-6-hydroxymethyldihydropteridine diphosphokinase [Lachnospiraceae bacterium]